jgi:hypothetical protein
MSHSRTEGDRNRPRWQRLRAWLLLCFLATWSVAPALAETTVLVRSAQVTLDDEVYELDTRLDLQIPEDARKAIEAGLTLGLHYEIELARVRRYLPDPAVAYLEQRYQLSYHALSQRYLVRNLNTGEQQDFGTFAAAIDRLDELNGLPILDKSLIEPGVEYEGRVRAVVDMSTAPAGLGWLLFWTDDWSATSEWYEWKLRP